ncbi:PilX N-terminal domain-containing pilus assembly protein [Bacillus alkalicellulosilyticus]|uniref:PilX N-terminal domain-containing pilus assembly protein n=1 Tax=Alkalihalobacterium alkalicellulosilyticum TaxID=1912214 RepID=UPI001482542B|nr:PilX N-terminal domain-containing pilus assembly protein [Bacillus alkalicellulosilyticus]
MPCKNHIQNEKGITLLLVLVVLVVISVMGLSLMGLAASNVQMSSGERDNQSTYYIAEAGATQILSNVNRNVLTYYNTATNATDFFTKLENEVLQIGSHTNINSFEEVFGVTPKANVKIEKVPGHDTGNIRKYKLVSEGVVDNRKRTVESTFTLEWKNKSGSSLDLPDDLAVFSENKIHLNGLIDGNIATNSIDPGAINLEWAGFNPPNTFKGTVYLMPGASENIIERKQGMIGQEYTFKPYTKTPPKYELPKFPDFPMNPGTANLIVSNSNTTIGPEDMTYNRITVNGGRTLTINVGASNQTTKIRVRELSVTNNGNIVLQGQGKLELYVDHSMTVAGARINNTTPQTDERITIYFSGPSLTVGNNGQIGASLFADKTNITIEGSGGIQGHIITGGSTVTVRGTSNAGSLLFAPNATVTATGSGHIHGAVIGKTFIVEGGGKVTHTPIKKDTLKPFFPDTASQISVDMLLTNEPIREK